MTEQRTPEDAVAGILRVEVGSETRPVPTLTVAQTRVWQTTLDAKAPGFEPPVDDDEWTPEFIARYANVSFDVLLDIVVAYDQSGALGGREWLENHANPQQLYRAVIQMIEVAYPFVADSGMFLRTLLLQPAASRPQPSTNGHSPTGGSTPGRSTRRSTRRS